MPWPLAPALHTCANALREWRLACPGELAFPGDRGQPISMRTVVRAWQAAQIAAGVVTDGNAKYPGLHALRHFYASWCINCPSNFASKMAMSLGVMRTKTACWPHSGPPKP